MSFNRIQSQKTARIMNCSLDGYGLLPKGVLIRQEGILLCVNSQTILNNRHMNVAVDIIQACQLPCQQNPLTHNYSTWGCILNKGLMVVWALGACENNQQSDSANICYKSQNAGPLTSSLTRRISPFLTCYKWLLNLHDWWIKREISKNKNCTNNWTAL